MSELGLECHVTEGQSGECSKQKKQHLAKLGGERKRVLFEELEVGETGAQIACEVGVVVVRGETGG